MEQPSCNICKESIKDEVECNTCTFKTCKECIIKWFNYRLHSRERNFSSTIYPCPQCNTDKSFSISYEDLLNSDDDNQEPFIILTEGHVIPFLITTSPVLSNIFVYLAPLLSDRDKNYIKETINDFYDPDTVIYENLD